MTIEQISAERLTSLGSPLALKIEGCPLAPYWRWDDIYEALDSWGYTNPNGDQERPFYVAYQREPDGTWTIGDYHMPVLTEK